MRSIGLQHELGIHPLAAPGGEFDAVGERPQPLDRSLRRIAQVGGADPAADPDVRGLAIALDLDQVAAVLPSP